MNLFMNYRGDPTKSLVFKLMNMQEKQFIYCCTGFL